MAKPKNLKQRTTDDTMKPLEGVRLDSFGTVDQRGWGRARDLSAQRNDMIFDWRLQWHSDENRKQQLVKIKIGKETAVFSRQELERYLRHV